MPEEIHALPLITDFAPKPVEQEPPEPSKHRNITEAILAHDGDAFVPESGPRAYPPTQAAPGSNEKKKVMSDRAEEGFDIHHPGDRVDFVWLERRLAELDSGK
ncbi:MAG: hypothetical protein V1926_04075 [Candidatus Peregrinibacteria bacterium]